MALERLVVEPGDFPRFLESIVLDRFNPCLKFHGDVSRTLPNLFFRLLRQEDGCDHNLIVHLKGELFKKEGLGSAARRARCAPYSSEIADPPASIEDDQLGLGVVLQVAADEGQLVLSSHATVVQTERQSSCLHN